MGDGGNIRFNPTVHGAEQHTFLSTHIQIIQHTKRYTSRSFEMRTITKPDTAQTDTQHQLAHHNMDSICEHSQQMTPTYSTQSIY